MADRTPLCLLLLPDVLERLAFADRGRDLLRAPGVVAVEPPRWQPRLLVDRVAATQARRLERRLPGVPRVVAVLDPAQYPLARALIGRHRDCELWYAPPDPEPAAGARAELHLLAERRAALRFSGASHPEQPAFAQNAPLWDRLERLGIARR